MIFSRLDRYQARREILKPAPVTAVAAVVYGDDMLQENDIYCMHYSLCCLLYFHRRREIHSTSMTKRADMTD